MSLAGARPARGGEAMTRDDHCPGLVASRRNPALCAGGHRSLRGDFGAPGKFDAEYTRSAKRSPMREPLPASSLLVGVLAFSLGCAARPDERTPVPPNAVSPAKPAAARLSAREESLLTLFGGYDTPVRKADLDRLGTAEELTEALVALYQDDSQPGRVRQQALANLRFYPSPRVRDLYEKELAAPGTSVYVRRLAIPAYAAAFKADAVPVLAKFVDDEELHTRNAAVTALGNVPSQAAVDILRGRLKRETETLVRASIETSLAKIATNLQGGRSSAVAK
jgi:hypothetical protein